MSAKQPDLPCQVVVEQVTDYLEHALAVDDRNQLEQHLLICAACRTFVEQHTAVINALSVLAAPTPPLPDTRARALAAFRRLRGKAEP